MKTRLKKTKTAYEIVIAFSGALNSVSADNLANYHLAAPGKGKKSKAYSKNIGLKSAVYGPIPGEVTLQLKGKLALTPPPQLRITASGMLDGTGRPLDGNRDGQPGGDYVALLTKEKNFAPRLDHERGGDVRWPSTPAPDPDLSGGRSRAGSGPCLPLLNFERRPDWINTSRH